MKNKHLDLITLVMKNERNFRAYTGTNWLECLNTEAMDSILVFLIDDLQWSFLEAKEYISALLESREAEVGEFWLNLSF